MTADKQLEQAKNVATELVEEAARDFDVKVRLALERIETSYPNLLFQEKHTSGWLWKKKTWYRYMKYSEGSMIYVQQYDKKSLDAFEKGK